jgi:dihydrofolate reductase
MGKLIYSAITSVDGYVCDDNGSFDWAIPSAEVHAFVNDLERPIDTYLYGRRMYETMTFWEHADFQTQQPVTDENADLRVAAGEYADIWRAADKVVYSRTLDSVSTARTRLARQFDVAEVDRMKGAGQGDLSIGGPDLASHALAAGLVDELHLFVAPAVVGSGRHYLLGAHRFDVELLTARTFTNGMVHQHYAIR